MAFTDKELAYLRSGTALGHIATVGADGTPHVVPVGWTYNDVEDSVDIGGVALQRTKKYRDIARRPRAGFVVDDIVSTDPWQVRGIEIRGSAEAIEATGVIRIHPERIVSWGLESDTVGERHAHSVVR